MQNQMSQRYRLFKRGWGVYYAFDNLTGNSESLDTRNKQEAERLLHAKNEAHAQPMLNLQMARAYLSATDPAAASRTWEFVYDAILKKVSGPTQSRWLTVRKDPALRPLWKLPLPQTRSEHFLTAINEGTVSTNVFLRRLHNYALGMNWLLAPVIAKKLWPAVVYKEKRGITEPEHLQIVERERNPERRAFYELCWLLGGSQTDIALLCADNIDWNKRLVVFRRKKSGRLSQIRFGSKVEAVLKALPQTGPLFPYLRSVRCCDRGTEFKQRCQGLDIRGVTLHSYRYAWAQRAKAAGYPERYAQEALGHGSKAVHRAYAAGADVELPPLEDFESKAANLSKGNGKHHEATTSA
jgi:integrase